MVSLRKLEAEQVIECKPRNSIDWEHVRGVTIGRLRRSGFDIDRAEELTQSAIVAVYAGNERISDERAMKDTFAECFGILHREAEERAKLAAASLPDDVGESRHVDQRTPAESTTVQTRNALRSLRAERELFAEFGWLITQMEQTQAPEQRLMRYLSELAYSAFGVCQDTAQLPPMTGRTVVVSHGEAGCSCFTV